MKLTPANIANIERLIDQRMRGVRAKDIAAGIGVVHTSVEYFMVTLKAIGVETGRGAKRGRRIGSRDRNTPTRPVSAQSQRKFLTAEEWEQRLSAL